MIVIFALPLLPLVKCFVNDQHAELVAHIEEILGHLVVGASDGVETIGLHQFYFSFFGTVYGSGTQQTVVMMQATAFRFQRLTIQLEAFIGRKGDGTYAERNRYLIIFLSAGRKRYYRRIKHRRIYRP